MWIIEQMDPGQVVYNIARAYRILGPLDIESLERSLREILRRHEALRATVKNADGTPALSIREPAEFTFPVTDLTHLPEDDRSKVAEEAALKEAGRPFNLAEDFFLRPRLFRLGAEEHLFLLNTHHIAWDAWSTTVFWNELRTLYEEIHSGRQPSLPPLQRQYSDIAARQRQELQGAQLEKLLSYWRSALADAPQLALPTQRPRPPRQSTTGATIDFIVPAELLTRLHTFARTEHATLYMVLLAGYCVWLRRLSGHEDIAVGTAIAGRDCADAEALIGFFVNTLAVRTRLQGNPSFREVVRRVRKSVLAAVEHQQMPFDKLIAELRPPRDLSRPPLFQTALVLHNTPPPQPCLAGLAVSEIPLAGTVSRFDLTVTMVERDGELHGRCEFVTDLFDRAVMHEWLESYVALLDHVVREADHAAACLPLLSTTQRERMLGAWNATSQDYPRELCLHHLVERQADKTPDGVAATFEGSELTYEELDRRANQLARFLEKYQTGPDSYVAICMDRSLEMAVAMLAVLKAGRAYVPIDPSHPPKRLAGMLRDAGATAIITLQRFADVLEPTGRACICLDRDRSRIECEDATRPDDSTTADKPAYMIFTSGSTGRPKGAINTHRGIVNRLLWMRDYLKPTAQDAVLQKTPFTFDVSVWEFFLPLVAGARLVLARPGAHLDPGQLLDLIAAQRVTIIHFVPSMLRVFLEAPGLERFGSIRDVICSGETLPSGVVESFYAQCQAKLHNLYGPTEAAIDVTAWECPRAWSGTNVPIGRPIANTQCYILDPAMQPVPIGVPGELYIGGVQVGLGYLGCADLTAEKFLPDPFTAEKGGRIYRTGDVCRYRDDGAIEFLGRLDHQVKIRGFRIELGEIEAVISNHDAVRQAVVSVDEEVPGCQRLVAYLVLHDGFRLSEVEWRRFAAESLPDHMIPSAFMLIDDLPLSANGKVDRASLPSVGRKTSGVSGGTHRNLVRDRNTPKTVATAKPPSSPAKDACLHQLFEAQVAVTPDRTAVVFEGEKLTYFELNRRAELLASRLAMHVAGPDTIVALWAEHSVEVIVGMIAALKAGAAFLPIDPSAPPDRVRFLLGDAKAAAVLTNSSLIVPTPLETVPVIALDTISWNAGESFATRGRSSSPIDLAYVVYTSGSTGQPKGVAVEHRNIVNYLAGVSSRLGFEPGMAHAAVSTLAADLSYTVVFGALVTGGCLHLISPERSGSQAGLAEYFRQHQIDVLKIVPSHLRALQSGRAPEAVLPHKLLILGGEASSIELIRSIRALAPHCAIHNHYGPTETAVGVTTFLVPALIDDTPSGTLPLGRPLPNVHCQVIDEHMQPVPDGTEGELYIGGECVARGYLNRPDLTAEKFIANPFSTRAGERLYRTGDRVRMHPNGDLEFLGRIDGQLKIRGYRVEPGEIESALRAHPGISDAVVVARTDPSGTSHLFAYVVPDDQRAVPPLGQSLHQLPNGLQVAHLNRNETDYIYREIFELQAYMRHGITLCDGDCVIDAGANIGLFTVFAHQLVRDLRVFAFEPNPVVFPLLESNARMHGHNVKCFPVGLSNEAGKADLTFFEGLSLLSGYRPDEQKEREVVKRYALNQNASNGAAVNSPSMADEIDDLLTDRFRTRTIPTELRTLSSVIATESIEQIDLLKINVEKSELDILRGVLPDDWPKIRQMVIEVDEEANLEPIVSLLEQQGFEVTAEQDPLLRGTELCYVYAIRPGADQRLVRDQAPHAHLRSIPDVPPRLITAQAVREHLRGRLPDYLVPHAVVFVEALPLTSNGKIDRSALPDPPQAPTRSATRLAPRDHREKTLLSLWRNLLKRDAIGMDDNFFDLGGDSILAIQIANRARDAGLEISPRHFFEHQTIATLATIAREIPNDRIAVILREIWKKVLQLDQIGVDENFFELGGDSILAIRIANHARQAGLELAPHRLFERQTIADLAASLSEAPAAVVDEDQTPSGPIPLTPIQAWFFEQGLANPHHWNQAIMLEMDARPDVAKLETAWRAVVARHDAFRLRFFPDEGGWRQEIVPADESTVTGFVSVELADLSEADREANFAEVINELQGSLNLQNGPLVQAGWLGSSRGGRFLMIAHHLVVDGVSWQLLLEDLALAYNQTLRGSPIKLPPLRFSFAGWAARLQGQAATPGLEAEAGHWLARRGDAPPLLNADRAGADIILEASTDVVIASLTADETTSLLKHVPPVYNTRINDALLAGLLWAAHRMNGAQSLSLFLEGHGRVPLWADVDVSRTVGWFTAVYPVDLDMNGVDSCEAVLKQVKEQLRKIPRSGIGYGILRYLGNGSIATELQRQPQPNLLFNYLGQIDLSAVTGSLYGRQVYGAGRTRSVRNRRIFDLEITALVVGGRLEVRWGFGRNQYSRASVTAMAEAYMDALRELIVRCLAPEARGYTPSDFPDAALNQDDLDGLLRQLNDSN